jgi:hypothetical protein
VTFYPTDFTPEVLADVAEERVRQHEKWGPQHHEDGTLESFNAEASIWRRYNDMSVATSGDTDWKGILLEEVYEALAETDIEKLRTELIQVAAVAVAWVEDLDSRG